MNEAVISERLLDQRLRNRIIESLDWIADTETGFEFGAGEWFNQFFDHYDGRTLKPFANSAMTEEERSAFLAVHELMEAAAAATPGNVTEGQLKASGWLDRIIPAARAALMLMNARGRFSEDIEEVSPTVHPAGEP